MNRSSTVTRSISAMPETVDFHPLFTQLQSRYPTSSLLCELVQIYEGNFIVRAVVQVGGETLVTSMASALSVEQAEDQARLRVLKLLGILSLASTALPSFQPSGFERLHPQMSGSMDKEPVAALTTPATPGPTTAATTFTEVKPVSIPPFSFETSATPEPLNSRQAAPSLDEPDLFSSNRVEAGVSVLPQPASDPPVEKAPQRNGKSKKAVSKPDAIPTPPPLSEPFDLTPLFLQIEGEMERIGWTKEQGRNHLQRTYNKRSRQQLTDEELVDFLNYLKTYPAADDVPFRG